MKKIEKKEKELDLNRMRKEVEKILRECNDPQKIRFAEDMERKINYLNPEELLKTVTI